jgi:hypothetical protein
VYDTSSTSPWSGTIKIHDNVVKNQSGNAININNPSPANIEIYNNLYLGNSKFNIIFNGNKIELTFVKGKDIIFENIDIDFKNDIKTFFEYFKNDYLIERKSNLAFQEEISLNLTDGILKQIDKILSK